MSSFRIVSRAAALTAALVMVLTACGSSPAASQDASASTASAAGAFGGGVGRSAGWRDALTGGPDRLDVATTVAPISSIARNVGGTMIRLHGIIPDATNSHTF